LLIGLLKKVLPFGFVCLVCLFIFEIGLRLTGQRYMGSFFVLDTERGWSLRPGASGWQTAEGLAEVRINRDGMRDREHPLEKPAGTVRIAVVGDSFTEALQVNAEKSFAGLLPAQLQGCPALAGRPVETLNFGTGGYGTGLELLTYRAKVRKYKPDLVVLAFFSQNDPFDNHPTLSASRPDAAPRFRLNAQGEITQTNPFAAYSTWQLTKAHTWDALRGLVNYSRLLQLAMQVQNVRRIRNLGVDNPEAVARLGADYSETLVYQPARVPEVEEAWRVTEALLRRFRDEVTADGAKFRVVVLTNPIQVHPDPATREAYRQRIGAETLYYPEQRLRGFAAAHKLDLTTLAETMAPRAEQSKIFFHGFTNTRMGVGHWNEAGHQAGAEIMAPDICTGLGLP